MTFQSTIRLAAPERESLAFGFGRHFCLGNSLARLEARALLETIARRFPDAELATDPAGIRWGGNAMLAGSTDRPAELCARL